MKKINYLLVFIGVIGLISVRFFEDKIFYDPFLSFFRNVGQPSEFPQIEWTKLIFNHFLRFLMNLFFSCFIIYFLLKNKRWTIESFFIISAVFVISLILYLICIYYQFNMGYLFPFYVRRFLIQPIILLILIPSLYYRKKITEEK